MMDGDKVEVLLTDEELKELLNDLPDFMKQVENREEDKK